MKRGREPATVLRPFFMLAGGVAPGEAERGCGRALVPRIWRCAPEGAAFLVPGPRAHLRTGGGSDQRARPKRQAPFRPLRTWSFAAASFAGAISCWGKADHHSVLPEISLARGCSRSRGKGVELDPRNTTSSATGPSRAVGNSGHTVRSGAAVFFLASSMGYISISRDAATDLPVMHKADSRFESKSLCHKALNRWANFPFSYRLPVI